MRWLRHEPKAEHKPCQNDQICTLEFTRQRSL